MKKLTTTFGLLALMLIVTSFTTASEIGGQGTKGDNGKGLGQFEIGGQGTKGDNGKGLGQFEIGGQGTKGDNGKGLGQ